MTKKNGRRKQQQRQQQQESHELIQESIGVASHILAHLPEFMSSHNECDHIDHHTNKDSGCMEDHDKTKELCVALASHLVSELVDSIYSPVCKNTDDNAPNSGPSRRDAKPRLIKRSPSVSQILCKTPSPKRAVLNRKSSSPLETSIVLQPASKKEVSVQKIAPTKKTPQSKTTTQIEYSIKKRKSGTPSKTSLKYKYSPSQTLKKTQRCEMDSRQNNGNMRSRGNQSRGRGQCRRNNTNTSHSVQKRHPLKNEPPIPQHMQKRNEKQNSTRSHITKPKTYPTESSEFHPNTSYCTYFVSSFDANDVNERTHSVSLVPYMISPENEIHILLGQEHNEPGWMDANTVSLFGGGREVLCYHATTNSFEKESFVSTIAREFIEETLLTLPISYQDLFAQIQKEEYDICLQVCTNFGVLDGHQGTKHHCIVKTPDQPFNPTLSKSTECHLYPHRQESACHQNLGPENVLESTNHHYVEPRYHIAYVKEIPWDPTVVATHRQKYLLLQSFAEEHLALKTLSRKLLRDFPLQVGAHERIHTIQSLASTSPYRAKDRVCPADIVSRTLPPHRESTESTRSTFFAHLAHSDRETTLLNNISGIKSEAQEQKYTNEPRVSLWSRGYWGPLKYIPCASDLKHLHQLNQMMHSFYWPTGENKLNTTDVRDPNWNDFCLVDEIYIVGEDIESNQWIVYVCYRQCVPTKGSDNYESVRFVSFSSLCLWPQRAVSQLEKDTWMRCSNAFWRRWDANISTIDAQIYDIEIFERKRLCLKSMMREPLESHIRVLHIHQDYLEKQRLALIPISKMMSALTGESKLTITLDDGCCAQIQSGALNLLHIATKYLEEKQLNLNM